MQLETAIWESYQFFQAVAWKFSENIEIANSDLFFRASNSPYWLQYQSNLEDCFAKQGPIFSKKKNKKWVQIGNVNISLDFQAMAWNFLELFSKSRFKLPPWMC